MRVDDILVICAAITSKTYCQDTEPSTSTVVPDDIDTLETTTMIFEDLSEEISTENMLREGEKKMSEHILEMLKQVQDPNFQGIPGVEIPDPLPIQDIRYPVTLFDVLYLENAAVHGISKLRVLYVNADFEDMKVDAAMTIDSLEVHGTYRYTSFLMPKKGPFTVKVFGLKITPINASLGVEIDGKLRAKDIFVDLTYENLEVNFKNLGALGFMNTISGIIIDLIKPSVLEEAYTKARKAIDEKLDETVGDIEFPNSIAPLDMVLVDARRKVRELKMDPYKVADYNSTILDAMSFVSFVLSNTWIKGLSTFHRIGDTVMRLENNTVAAKFQIGTQKLEGTTHWEVAAGIFMSLFGTASFSVEYVSAEIIIAQSLDMRKKPELRHIHLDVGNIQARCDGAGTIDYVIEFVINVLPNLLRYQMLAVLEQPLKTKLQEEFNGVDVEEEIKLASPRIDELAASGFKLSYLRNTKEEYCDSDDFFNF